MTFLLGNRVTWRSQAAGTWREKVGVVSEVVLAGRRPSSMRGGGGGFGRKAESYVVHADNGRRYWPHESLLKLVSTGVDCPACGGTGKVATPTPTPEVTP